MDCIILKLHLNPKFLQNSNVTLPENNLKKYNYEKNIDSFCLNGIFI